MMKKTTIFTLIIVTAALLFSFGCSRHQYSNTSNKSMDKPMAANTGHKDMNHIKWEDWPYQANWTE